MKSQTRLGSLWESTQNVIVGYVISVGATWSIGPYFGLRPPTFQDLLGFGLAMTVVSVVRSYAIRRWNEWKRARHAPPDFLHIAEELAGERLRQINGEGYSLAHDDAYDRAELQRAAGWYALASASYRNDGGPLATEDLFEDRDFGWPWDMAYWKSQSERRDLVKAGALIIAAIGRIDRHVRRRLAP